MVVSKFDSDKAIALVIIALVISIPLSLVYTGVTTLNFIAFCFVMLYAFGFGREILTIPSLVNAYISPTKKLGGRYGDSSEWVSSSPVDGILVFGLCFTTTSQIIDVSVSTCSMY